MLSRVAERVYWAARYLERIENTARLLSIYDKLLFDLPKSTQLSWYNLISINSLEEKFEERYSIKDERNVVKFMIADETNTSSITTSLNAIRENIRTTRDVVPEETWELVNELSLYVKDNIKLGINRGHRYEFLDEIIKSCHQIQGLLYGNMAQDAAWNFLRLGRNLERADMTSRILDAGVAGVIETSVDDNAINTHQLIMGHVLRSLNAMQSYRRHVRTPVDSKCVIEYIINNEQFPRTITYCYNAMHEAVTRLPKNKAVLTHLIREDTPYQADSPEKMGAALRDHLNEIQIHLGDIHEHVRQNWFALQD